MGSTENRKHTGVVSDIVMVAYSGNIQHDTNDLKTRDVQPPAGRD